MATINGTQGNDNLVGTSGDDIINGLGGNDVLEGGLGADQLNGGDGEDTATYIHSSTGLNIILMPGGTNTGEAAGDTFNSVEDVVGTNFDDFIAGDNGDNKLYGMGGNDTLYGWGGVNYMYGGDGDDNIVGGPGIDHMDGEGGTGNLASYQLSSSGVIASLGNPSINTGDAAGDTYANIYALTGTNYDDVLYGDSTGHADQLWGLAGTNTYYAGTGYTTEIAGPDVDHMFGGAGGTLADYETATAAVIASLANPLINTGYAAGDTYSNVEDLAGSAYSDTLYGDNLGNNMLGLAGDDTMYGGGGSDTLTGGPGADTLYGGAQTDLFIFTDDSVADGQKGIIDRIADYDQGNSGSYVVTETDGIDLAQISALNHGSGQSVDSLVRVLEDSSNTFAHLQVFINGSWVEIARMDGLQSNETVRVVLDDASPAGSMVTVQGGSTPAPPPQTTSGTIDEWKIVAGTWAGSVAIGSHGSDTAAVGDFNGDGTSDVAWFNSSTGFVDEWQLANGNWAASIPVGTHPGAGWIVPGAGDFNGDGTSDILFVNPSTGQTDIWELAGGKWAASVTPGAHPGGYQVGGIGDINHDGTSDIFWVNPTTNDVDVWKIAKGTWAGSVDIGAHPGSGWAVGGIGDFNGDGTSDVMWFNSGTGQTDIWELANGQWAASVTPGNHPTGWTIGGIGDFNHDGTSDILFVNAAGQTDIWELANGKWAGSVSPGTHPAGFAIAGIGDFNHDGTSDILWHGL